MTEQRLSTTFHWYLSIGLLAFFYVHSSIAQAQPIIQPIEKWTTVFADKEVKLHFTLESKDGFKGEVYWTFAAENKRTFPRGTGSIPVDAKAGKPVELPILLVTPHVKPGVVLKGVLTLTAVADGKETATLERTIWIYPEDAFADRGKWLEDLKITIYDSAREAKTVRLLEKFKIPFEEITNPAALDEMKEGLILIGEGVSFQEERGLAEILVHAAARGLTVICLAPRDGLLPVPGSADNDTGPQKLRWRKQDIITELNNRLDADAWPPLETVVGSSLVIKVDDDKVAAEAVNGAKGWPWFEVDYANRGKLLVIGFPVVRHWEDSPTPRYLFARLLEYVTEKPEETEDKRSNDP
jgi:hypothetical protein